MNIESAVSRIVAIKAITSVYTSGVSKMQHSSGARGNHQSTVDNAQGSRRNGNTQGSRTHGSHNGSTTSSRAHSDHSRSATGSRIHGDHGRNVTGSRQHVSVKKQNEHTKQWLWRYREAKKEVVAAEEQFTELVEMQNGAKAIQYSDMPKGSGSQADLSDMMAQRDKSWREVEEARHKQTQAFKEIWGAIHQLPVADEVTILTYRYIRMMKWENICLAVRKEWAQVHRHHARALRQIGEIIKDKC